MTRYVLVAGDFVRTGGMDVANFALADYLAREGEDVHLVAFRVSEELAAYPNVTAHTVRRPLGYDVLGAPLLGAAALLRQRDKAARFVVNGGNAPLRAINWVHYVHAAYTPKSVGGKFRRLKDAVSHHTARMTERVALQRARLVVANSELTRTHLVELIGIPAERVRAIYYGIDPARFHPVDAEGRARARKALQWDDRPRVVFIGALGNRRKGFDVLWSAWTRLCRGASWDATLVVVGQGAELDRWRAEAGAAGMKRRVDFLGFRSDVPLILGASDLLVAPTRYEAYGLGVHEALCCGLPAIVSTQSGVAERYPSTLRDLLLPDPDDVSDLVARLTRWRERESTFQEAASAFGATLRARTWDDMAREIRVLSEGLDWGLAPAAQPAVKMKGPRLERP